MRSYPLRIVGLTPRELADYTAAQLAAIIPDKRVERDRETIYTHLEPALARLAVPTTKVVQWKSGFFDPLISSQHASFLYFLANTIWKETNETEVSTKLFLLNKALHGIEVYFKIDLPDIFLFVHTAGIVLVNTTYGRYFTIFQNSTVGRVGDDRPTLGAGVLMFPNTAIIGRAVIGDHTTLSQGTSVINIDTPGNVIVFAAGRRIPLMKAPKTRLIENYYRAIDI